MLRLKLQCQTLYLFYNEYTYDYNNFVFGACCLSLTHTHMMMPLYVHLRKVGKNRCWPVFFLNLLLRLLHLLLLRWCFIRKEAILGFRRELFFKDTYMPTHTNTFASFACGKNEQYLLLPDAVLLLSSPLVYLCQKEVKCPHTTGRNQFFIKRLGKMDVFIWEAYPLSHCRLWRRDPGSSSSDSVASVL